MRYKGRIFAIGVVGFFNILRYFYYHWYMGIPFRANFFILTAIFLMTAWWCGKQFDRAKYFSEIDPLTNTFNRRTIQKTFQTLAFRSKKENKKLGVIMIDLNNFKKVNDTFGHTKGDELIKHVAMILHQIVKKDDVIARWGGDEFLILAPKINGDFDSTYIPALQRALENSVIENLPSIGASVGFAIFPDQGESFQELIQKADREMYKSKGL